MPVRELNGVDIHYEVVGRGEPVVLLNGVMMTTQSWVLQTSVLRRRYRCVLHDFRGQLLSEKPAGPFDLDDHAEDLRALLDHLGIERCHMVGTSYGGEVGLVFALTYPGRVKSLSVIASVSEVGEELDRQVATWARAAAETPDDLYRISLPMNFSAKFVAANPDVIDKGEARIQACPPEFFSGLVTLIDAFRRLDITGELHRIDCPTLILVGGADVLKTESYSRLLAENIPAAEFLVVPDAGHAVIIEKPGEVNTALLGFLAKSS